MDKIKNILLYNDLSTIRLFLAMSSIVWGILLFWQGDTFARPTYHVMGLIADELVWGGLFFIQGIVALYSLITEKETELVFFIDALLGCVLWTGSCIAMLMSVYPPPAAISAEITAAISSWWILVRYNGKYLIELPVETVYAQVLQTITKTKDMWKGK